MSASGKPGFFDSSKANTWLDRVGLSLVKAVFGTLALLTRQSEDIKFGFLLVSTIRFL